MCNCSKLFVFLLLICIFFQLSNRWERDNHNLPKWLLSSNMTLEKIEREQSVLLHFQPYEIHDGKPFTEIQLTNDTITSKDNIKLKMNVYIKIQSFPLSYHTVLLKYEVDKEVREFLHTSQVNEEGIGTISFYNIFKTNPSDKIYIEYINGAKTQSNVFMYQTLTNGLI